MNQSPEGSFTAQQNQLMSSPAVPIATNEMFDDATNRDQLTSTSLSFLQSQYETHNSPSSANKVDYFEPNESQETPPYLDSKQFADNGPTKEDLKTIQPLLESENDIAKAIIKDSWSQGKFWTIFLRCSFVSKLSIMIQVMLEFHDFF